MNKFLQLWRNAAVIGLGLFAGWAQAESNLPTGLVASLEVPRIYRLDGVVEASNSGTISAQTGGQIREIRFDVDDLVEQGQVIMVLDDKEQKTALKQARANLQAAQARRQQAQREYDRIAKVYAKKVVSKAVMDKAVSERKSAIAGVSAAKAAVSQAQQQLDYTQVKAPYTGIVTKRLVEVGEVAARGQQLMSGISLEQLRVNVDVPQSLIAAVRAERDAAVLLGGRWVKASDITVFPVADRGSDSFRVRLQLPEGFSGVFPGMYVKVAFNVGQRRVFAVPREAVVYRSEVVAVYVLDGQNRVSMRHIRLGSQLPDGGYVVLSGLDAGEQVITDPQAAVEQLKAQREERRGHE